MLAAASQLFAAGFSHNANFIVFTPAENNRNAAEAYAEQVLEQAEAYRQAIAREWLGSELPPSVGRTIINVRFSQVKDQGVTWPKEDLQRRYHNIYLTTTRELALGETLKHEVAHVVLTTRYAGDRRLAPWVEEGIASRYDDAERIAIRKSLIRWFDSTQQWPEIEAVVRAEMLPIFDQKAYTVAATLVDFLIQRRDKATFLRFAESARTRGWNESLQTHYDIRNLDQLQQLWQTWVKRQDRRTTDLAAAR